MAGQRKSGLKTREFRRLEARLNEAEETLRAIRNGEVDGLIVQGAEGEQVFSLKSADQPYRLMVEHMQEGAASFELRGVVLYCNQSFASMVKRPLERVIGSGMTDWLVEKDHPKIEAVLGCPEPTRMEVLLRATDGARVPVLISVNDSVPAGIQGCWILVTDLTEQMRVQKIIEDRTEVAEQRAAQLRKLAAELTQVEHRERRRLATVLHDDLQQLLVAAQLNLSTLRGRVPAQHSPAIERVVSLLDKSVRASRSLTQELSPPVLYEAGLARALEWLGRWMLETHGLQVDLEIERGSEPQNQQVRVLLFQAARELLFNVVKHARVKRAVLHIQQAPGGKIKMTVSDAGVGFQRRQPGDELPGFGLFNIRERFDWLGGEMRIESAPAHGTTITLYAPEVQGGTPAAVEPARHEMAEEADENSRNVRELDRRQIGVMLVDDHAIVRQGLASLLAAQPDMQVIAEAADGESALDCARRVDADVVVMDHSMPGMSGVETTRRLLAENPDLHVIGLSLHEAGDMGQAFRDAGAVAYLTKGGPAENLIAAIRACASVHQEQ